MLSSKDGLELVIAVMAFSNEEMAFPRSMFLAWYSLVAVTSNARVSANSFVIASCCVSRSLRAVDISALEAVDNSICVENVLMLSRDATMVSDFDFVPCLQKHAKASYVAASTEPSPSTLFFRSVNNEISGSQWHHILRESLPELQPRRLLSQ